MMKYVAILLLQFLKDSLRIKRTNAKYINQDKIVLIMIIVHLMDQLNRMIAILISRYIQIKHAKNAKLDMELNQNQNQLVCHVI